MERTVIKEKAKQTIDEIFLKLDELEAKKDQVLQDAKEEYQEVLAELKKKREALEFKYHEMLHATEENWEEVKTTFTASAESFKEGFTILGSLFKK
jgi:hypothetical protein